MAFVKMMMNMFQHQWKRTSFTENVNSVLYIYHYNYFRLFGKMLGSLAELDMVHCASYSLCVLPGSFSAILSASLIPRSSKGRMRLDRIFLLHSLPGDTEVLAVTVSLITVAPVEPGACLQLRRRKAFLPVLDASSFLPGSLRLSSLM